MSVRSAATGAGWRRLGAAVLVSFVAGGASTRVRTSADVDPFAFFQPTAGVSPDDVARLDRGATIIRILAGEDGEVAVAALVKTSADGPRLLAWVRHISELKKSPFVPAVARFSDPPRLGDVEALTLDDHDLTAIRSCRPGSCDVKLSAVEMASLQADMRAAGPAWRAAIQDAFRRLVVDRVRRYLANGQAAVGPYADQGTPTVPQAAFGAVLRHTAFLAIHAPRLVRYLEEFPDADASGIESFVYWSKERLGGRPSIIATAVIIPHSREDGWPEALVLGRQIFASHYVTASLNVTAIVRGRTSADHYLVYLNRSHVDVLDRWYGGLARRLIEGHIRNEAATAFDGLKSRLESGPPPAK